MRMVKLSLTGMFISLFSRLTFRLNVNRYNLRW